MTSLSFSHQGIKLSQNHLFSSLSLARAREAILSGTPLGKNCINISREVGSLMEELKNRTVGREVID